MIFKTHLKQSCCFFKFVVKAKKKKKNREKERSCRYIYKDSSKLLNICDYLFSEK